MLVLMVAPNLVAQQLAQQPLGSQTPLREIRSASERLEITVNESRILFLSPSLTAANRIPQAQVNNREILELTPLSPTQIQVFAKKAGVTQVNIWDENGQIYTVDVVVFGDAKELSLILESEFPNASLTVKPIASGVLISGYVDQPEDVPKIREIAEQYYSKVLTNIRVAGVHQVLLHVKAMEVSRTKLRSLGLDWSSFSPNTVVHSMGAGVLSGVTQSVRELPGGVQDFGYSTITSGAETFRLSVIDGADAFFAVLDALRRDSLMKVLAEPTLVTVSGRPAFFQVGGEVPTLAPAGLGTVSIEYKRYGTQVDFVPIVLGNGRIRLEVRPRVSDVDLARSITVDGQTIYAFTTREVDTGVELQAGQTLAIAGLVQNRLEAEKRGLPVLSDLPIVGIPFRRVSERANEIELLILVTPELVEGIDKSLFPQGGPGYNSASPSDWQLYVQGRIEVPLDSSCGVPVESGEMPGLYTPPSEIGTAGEAVMRPDSYRLPMEGSVPAEGRSAYTRLNSQQAGPGRRTPRQTGPPNTVISRGASAASPSSFPTMRVDGRPGGQAPQPHTQSRDTGNSRTTGTNPTSNGSNLPGLIGPVGYEAPAK